MPGIVRKDRTSEVSNYVILLFLDDVAADIGVHLLCSWRAGVGRLQPISFETLTRVTNHSSFN